MLCLIMAKKMLEYFKAEPHRQQLELAYEKLTQRELEVLQRAADGLSNKEIAARLVSVKRRLRATSPISFPNSG